VVSRPDRGRRSGSFRHAMLPDWAHAMCRQPGYDDASSVFGSGNSSGRADLCRSRKAWPSADGCYPRANVSRPGITQLRKVGGFLSSHSCGMREIAPARRGGRTVQAGTGGAPWPMLPKLTVRST
jgi:hypothetical protein